MTRTCPHCGGPLVPLSSMNIRLCADCKTEHPWKLEAGQAPIVSNNRLTARTNPDIVPPVKNAETIK